MLKKTYIFLLLALAGITGYADGNKGHKTVNRYATLNLIVGDTSTLRAEFEMCDKGINTAMTLKNMVYKFALKPGENTMKVPLSTSENYGRIWIYKGEEKALFNFNDNLFIFQMGDNIRIDLTAGTGRILFSGTGSPKYTCAYEIAQHQEINLDRENDYYHKGDYLGTMDARKQQIDSLYNLHLSILKANRAKIPLAVYNLLAADCLGKRRYNEVGMAFAKIRSDTRFRDAISYALQKYISIPMLDSANQNILANSYYYCDYLVLRALCEAIYEKNERFSFNDILKNILKDSQGILRDKTILLAFYNYAASRHNTTGLFNTALSGMGGSIYSQALKVFAKAFAGEAYSFALPDAEGKIWTLDMFKGKVVVMDFWFTGCVNCKALAQAIKPVIESYKGNENIVFISVCIDPKQMMWLESVAKEEYSTKAELNLYTEGLGNRHPLIKQYNITGYPTQLIISKDGKFLSMAPPRVMKDNPESVKAFKDFVGQYL